MFDSIRLCKYLTKLDEQAERKTMSKHDQLIMLLIRKCFGTALGDGKKHIQNLSDYVID